MIITISNSSSSSSSSSNNTSPHKLAVYDRGQGCEYFLLMFKQGSEAEKFLKAKFGSAFLRPHNVSSHVCML
jgi:hypothetical protein